MAAALFHGKICPVVARVKASIADSAIAPWLRN